MFTKGYFLTYFVVDYLSLKATGGGGGGSNPLGWWHLQLSLGLGF